MKKVAIIYHYLALYRLPVFRELMKSTEMEYIIYSGNTSEISIKKIDDNLSTLNIKEGGLRWKILKNRWFFNKKLLWQSGLIKMVLTSDYNSYVFLGSPYFISTWFAALIARLRGKKVYYWMHGIYTDRLSVVDYIKMFAFYKLAHGFFLYGNRAAKILEQHRVKNFKDIHLVYNSLDYSKTLEYRRTFKEGEVLNYRKRYFDNIEVPVIVFIGRLNNVKRIDRLIKAQQILKEKNGAPFFNLLVIGDGEEKETLINLSKELEIESNVVFLGAVYDEEINSFCLMNADLCVTPGEVGLTAIHSLSYGTPVISHDNLNIQMPEVEAIKIGKTGDLYKYDDLQSLAETIERWLLNNPFKSEELRQECYSVIDSFYNPTYQLKIFDAVLKN